MPHHIINPYRFTGGLPPIPEATHWEFITLANRWSTGGSESGVALTQIEMAAYPGGPNLCVGGTPYTPDTMATDTPDGHVSRMFDGNPNTYGRIWATAAPYLGPRIGYIFAAPVSIRAMRMRPLNTRLGGAPNGIVVRYSVDGGTTYHCCEPVSSLAPWVADEVREFPVTQHIPKSRAQARLWRYIPVGVGFHYFAEIQYRGENGGPNLAVGGVAYCPSMGSIIRSPNAAFDGAANTYWLFTYDQPNSIQYFFPTAPNPQYIALQKYSSLGVYPPTGGSVYWSSDGVNWNFDATVPTEGGWTGSQIRQYPLT